MTKEQAVSNYLNIAKFLGRALFVIAEGKELTTQDFKDATDAVNAVGQLALDNLNEDEAAALLAILAEASKSTTDLMSPAPLGGWESKMQMADNFNDSDF